MLTFDSLPSYVAIWMLVLPTRKACICARASSTRSQQGEVHALLCHNPKGILAITGRRAAAGPAGRASKDA